MPVLELSGSGQDCNKFHIVFNLYLSEIIIQKKL